MPRLLGIQRHFNTLDVLEQPPKDLSSWRLWHLLDKHDISLQPKQTIVSFHSPETTKLANSPLVTDELLFSQTLDMLGQSLQSWSNFCLARRTCLE